MNKFKRILSLMVAMVLMLTVLSGCGNQVSDELVTSDSVVTEAPEVTTEATTTTEVTTTEEVTTTTEATTVATTEATTTATAATTASTDYTVEAMSATMYATYSVNVRSGPSADYDRIGGYAQGAEVTVTGRASTGWYQVDYKGETGYVSSSYLSTEPVATTATITADDDSVDLDDEATTTAATTSSSTTSSVITVSAGDWAEDNGWETMISYMKEDRFVSTIDQIMTGVQNYEASVTLGKYITEDEAYYFANRILPMICVEYSYVSSISAYTGGGYVSRVVINYNIDREEEGDQMVSELRTAANKIIANLKSSMSSYEKVKYLTDTLVKNCAYNGETATCNTAYAAIVEGQANCAGYAKGLFYLLAKAGFDVVFCEGVGDSANHLWVKVKIDGTWTNIDPTWCDPQTPTSIDPSYVDYSFLCVNDEFMAATHAEIYDMVFYNVPSATSTKYDWYVLNGCYATSLSEAVSILESATKTAVAEGSEYVYVRIKVSSSSIYSDLASSYKQSGYNNKILSSITSKYTCDGVLPREAGLYRVYRLKLN
ncbi:MAG: SH3 domain-containing protein [Oscillospiraceae bacterium]|nr:SH3 domain-containing protein [Oscillospiraceae bacterium]